MRRLADRSLVQRCEGMGLGERTALARRAGRGVIDALCKSDETPVLRVLLTHPRLIESDAVKIAASAVAPPDLLSHLAQHPRWGTRRDVRLALVSNDRTPIRVALRIVRRLASPDLRGLSRQPRLPRIVRMAVLRRLQRRETSRAVPALQKEDHG